MSGFVSWFFASREREKNISILAGVFSGFGFYILALALHVDDDNLGMLFAFAFPGLAALFAGAGWLGVQFIDRPDT